MAIKSEPFGQTASGEAVHAFCLENARGLKVKLMTYGAAIVSIETPDRSGALADIVLGCDDLKGYLAPDNPYFGACCGRFAGRIARGRFQLDGKLVSLAVNDSPHSLHGGTKGFDKKLWKAEIVDDQTVKMDLVSPDGDEGYPGTLTVELTYRLDDAGELRIDYAAATDRKTVLNLTNHSYFNLSGGDDVLAHEVQLFAEKYLAVDGALLPTGELKDVAGTALDFRRPRPIRERIDQVPGGYDHTYCLDPVPDGRLRRAARIFDPASGRTLECWTTQPGLQFYTGNHLAGIAGKGGRTYQAHAGFCLETQHYPDSPNRPGFPATELAPDGRFRQRTIYRFGVGNRLSPGPHPGSS